MKEGYHYAIVDGEEVIVEKREGLKYPYCRGSCITDWKWLGEVPSYDDWQQLENWARFTTDYHALKEELEIAEYENAELKEVLHIIKRQCELLMPKNGLNPVGDRAVMKMFLNKINEVLK